MGALVGDAASLGCHWIYDVDRLALINEQNGGMTAFTPIDPENYADVPSSFVHGQRLDGMLSHYGETLRLAIRSMIEFGGTFDIASYQQDYFEFFGPGGRYQGYIDHATRGTLGNISNEILDPSGVDDGQHPAITRLPAIVVCYGGGYEPDGVGDEDFAAEVEDAIRVTNVNDDASTYGYVFADLLRRVLNGAEISDAMAMVAAEAPDRIKQSLIDALNSDEESSTIYGEATGRACNLEMSVPLIFHILKRASGFEEAIEMNNLAAGDNAGRAIILGSLMGARFGIAGEHGIPLAWILSTHEATALWRECETLAEMG